MSPDASNNIVQIVCNRHKNPEPVIGSRIVNRRIGQWILTDQHCGNCRLFVYLGGGLWLLMPAPGPAGGWRCTQADMDVLISNHRALARGGSGAPQRNAVLISICHFLGLAVGDDQIGLEPVYRSNSPGLWPGWCLVFRFEAVGAGDAAALGVEHRHLDPGNGPQQFQGIDDAPIFSMGRGVVGDVQIERFHRRLVALIELVPDKTGYQRDAIPHLWLSCSSRWGYSSRRVKPQVEEVAKSGISLPSRGVLQLLDVEGRLLLGLVHEAVGNERHAAALLPRQQLDADVHGVEHLHQLLAELRVVVVHTNSRGSRLFGAHIGPDSLSASCTSRRKVPGSIFGQVTVGDPSALSSTSFIGLRLVVKLTTRAIRVDMPHQIGVGEHGHSRIPSFEAAVLVLGGL